MSGKRTFRADDAFPAGPHHLHPDSAQNGAAGHPAGEKACRPLRVLMVGSDPSVRGGISGVIGQIRGFDWSAAGIHMEFIPTYIESNRIRQLWFFLAALRQIRHTLRTAPPDLVHIHMSYRGSYVRKNYVRRLCRRRAVPYVLHLHGSQFRSWYDSCGSRLQGRIRRMLREAAAVIVMGERWRAAILEIEPAARVVIICNAVTIPRLPSDEGCVGNPAPADNTCANGLAASSAETFAARPDWRFSGRERDEFQVLFLGVLIPRKGVRDLLEAVRILREAGKLGGMRFVIAGSGPEEETLYAMTARYELEDVVTFAGWVDGGRKEALLRESQALVLPSYAEGLPVAVLEAISYGLPVIAADVGDTAMAVHDGDTGYLIAPGDPRQLAERLSLLYSDRELCGRMSRNARQLAEEKFSEERLCRQLETCWRGCIENHEKNTDVFFS